MRLPRYGKAGRMAISEYLREHDQKAYVLLFTLSAVADSAAIEAGRKSDLFDSLDEYRSILPSGCEVRWVGQGSGGILVATNPHYEGEVPEELKREHQPLPGAFDAATDAHVQPYSNRRP